MTPTNVLVGVVVLVRSCGACLLDVPAELDGVPGEVLGKGVRLGPRGNDGVDSTNFRGVEQAGRQRFFQESEIVLALRGGECVRRRVVRQAGSNGQPRCKDGPQLIECDLPLI